jgi:bifunctional DNase/RNase
MRAAIAIVTGLVAVAAAGSASAQVAPGALPARAAGVYATASGPAIILEIPGSPLFLPIFVAQREAEVAEGYLRGQVPPRPMTHDLLRNVIVSLGGRVAGVYVSDLRDRTFIGRVDILQAGALRQIDARSSDAVCLGLAAGAPIFVMQHVLAGGGMTRAQLAQQGIFLR